MKHKIGDIFERNGVLVECVLDEGIDLSSCLSGTCAFYHSDYAEECDSCDVEAFRKIKPASKHVTKSCAWCSMPTEYGYSNRLSHGMCPTCFKKGDWKK